MDNLTVFHVDQYGVPQPVRFDDRQSAWLRFYRWLVQTKRLHDQIDDSSSTDIERSSIDKGF